MGYRGNIAVIQATYGDAPEERIYLYSHWGGYRLPSILKEALIRGWGRWSDTSYLGRIIFCEMVKESVDGTTGYGISTRICGNEYNVLVVDPNRTTVSVESEDGKHLATLPFSAYIALTDQGLSDFRDRGVFDMRVAPLAIKEG